MADLAIITKVPINEAIESTVSQFRQEILSYQALLNDQTVPVQRFIQLQALTMAEAVVQGVKFLKFSLPDRVVLLRWDLKTYESYYDQIETNRARSKKTLYLY